jgi:uncharacterized protein
MKDKVTLEKLNKYFSVTEEALNKAKEALNGSEQAEDFLDMVQRYFDDAKHFFKDKEDMVLAFAALNYAHGWLDAGARSGLFKVNDSRLFTVDNE